jgi:hypothetical protein
MINKDGKEVIPFKYENVFYFNENNLAVVVHKKKYGFINKKGELIVRAKYDAAEDFYESLAVVGLKNKEGKLLYGYIDETGKEVIPCIYTNASSFDSGKAKVILIKGNDGEKDFIEKEFYIDKNGNELKND